jgi:hypothetical protein
MVLATLRPWMSRAVVFALTAAIAAPARAWIPNGVPLDTSTFPQSLYDLAPDDSSGAYVVWSDFRSGQSGIYLQHVRGDGTIGPGWPAAGLRPASTDRRRLFARLIDDGEGGVFVAWHDRVTATNAFDVYLQRLTYDGNVSAGWPADGVHVAAVTTNQGSVTLVRDDAGGVLLAWHSLVGGVLQTFAQRITGLGAVALGWPADGVAVCTGTGDQRLPRTCSDGAGGIFVTWEDGRNATLDIYAQRVAAGSGGGGLARADLGADRRGGDRPGGDGQDPGAGRRRAGVGRTGVRHRDLAERHQRAPPGRCPRRGEHDQAPGRP